jgi:ATP-dependent DNA ligase
LSEHNKIAPSALIAPRITLGAVSSRESNAKFIEPMLLLAAETLPEGAGWTHELKLDGYRALGIKAGHEVRLRSRNDKDFNRKYPAIAKALATLPDDTVIDGEVVALDADGRPSFNALQNGAAEAAIFYSASGFSKPFHEECPISQLWILWIPLRAGHGFPERLRCR